MSGIAGIVQVDGPPVAPGEVERMTASMAHRGPDGISHWRQGGVALGQCMLRTTPESLEECLPLTNDDGELTLVMDGRVDNADALRRELLGRGAVLRSRADAELVLRAYETWGEESVHHIVGELVFFVWDARRRTLFGARDAAGARHVYFHNGRGRFAFASEIRALLVSPQVERRVNESRVLDFLLPEFDREDEVGTFWQDIVRLPAGHAMRVGAEGPKTWRWWQPAEQEPQAFASMAECTEAFMAQLGEAVQCRLRSHRPLGAMLSGGLDSSSIVGLISTGLRSRLTAPLHTVSLIREDRDHCPDWRSIETILKQDDWLRPHIITSAQATERWGPLMQARAQADEPFAFSHGLTYHLTYQAAAEAGCKVLLDGMAGDLHFYSAPRSLHELMAGHRLADVRALLATYARHGWNSGAPDALRVAASLWAPPTVRHGVRKLKQEQLRRQTVLRHLEPSFARAYLASRQSAPAAPSALRDGPRRDLERHAAAFTSGVISFAHETYGLRAFANGVEPRSPFSDRRLIEFSVRMPLAAKLALPWYKHLLRQGTAGILPDAVRWRTDVGGHPGGHFYAAFARRLLQEPVRSTRLPAPLHRWSPNAPPPGSSRPDLLDHMRLRLLAEWHSG